MSASTWTFLDVSVVRIQRYLSRTPDLKGRRGASASLSAITGRDRLAVRLTELPELDDTAVEVNPEAGEADGVVPLRLPFGADPDPVARAVMSDLRAALPAVELRARWFHGPSYVEAYQTGTLLELTALPAPGDFPPLETCGICRIDPGSERLTTHPDQDARWACADCLARYRAAPALPVREEQRLLDRAPAGPRRRLVQGFDELAALGDERGNANQLATIFIDGNAMGELFGKTIQSQDPTLKAQVSRAVSTATRTALSTATAAVVRQDSTIPVIPHVVGGDDLLVSVVADRAWTFVRTYLAEFGRGLAAVTHPLGGPLPTASAGVVFAHRTFPFRRSVELAEDRLRAAKQAHAGQAAAVSWIDVTRDGERPPPSRAAWTLTDLQTADDALRALGAVEPAGRSALERLVDPARTELSRARLREHARRLGRADILEAFLGDDGTVARVADALALVRWWR